MSEGYSGRTSEGDHHAGLAGGRGNSAREAGSVDGVALGHRPVIPPRIGKSPGRLDARVLDLYKAFDVTDVSDAVGRLYTMDGGIRPLYGPMRRIVGVALTVKAPPGDNWAVHGALGRVEQDDVLVIDWQGYGDGCGSGARALGAAIGRGLAGVIVDGAWRDIGDLQAMDFPVCGRGISAFSPAKRELGEINVPVCCGGVIVEPGDVIVADREGSVVVPRRHAEEVARYLAATEERPGGGSPQENGVETAPDKIAAAYQDAFSANGGLRG